MVGVFSGHTDPQGIENTLGVVEAECGWWQFFPHCLSLREEEEEKQRGEDFSVQNNKKMVD